MKKLCAFDLDGTLVNTISDIGNAVNHSLELMNKPTHPLECYNKMVGNGMELLCKRALGNGTDKEVKELISLYNSYYMENCCVLSKPYDGIIQLLNSLKENNFILAIITNKPQNQSNEVISKLFCENTFDYIIGSNNGFPKKPDPSAFKFIMEHFNVSAEQSWFVGDSDVDIEFAKNSNTKSIGVSWGFRGEEELKQAGADFIAHNASELEEIILESF